jgi:hypothetical protein
VTETVDEATVREDTARFKKAYKDLLRQDIGHHLKYFQLSEDAITVLEKCITQLRKTWKKVATSNNQRRRAGDEDVDANAPRMPFWCPLSLIKAQKEGASKRKSMD